MVRIDVLAAALVLPLLTASCEVAPKKTGEWPPEDFLLEVSYSVVRGAQAQVRQKARIIANGSVVYREADASLRSEDGTVQLPIFRKWCAYKMRWESIRQLSRLLHDQSVKNLAGPPPAVSAAEESHVVRLELRYMGVRVEAEARDRAVGLMNKVLRIVNSYLPPGHGIKMPQTEGVVLENRLQDVPAMEEDSLEDALAFHQKWMSDPQQFESPPTSVLKDTFALACEARQWLVAESCLSRLLTADPAQETALRQILETSRKSASTSGTASPAVSR